MLKTATITFHKSNNNGSFLQAYALQKTILQFDEVSNEIIDFQTEAQIQQYNIFKKNNSLKNVVRNVISLFDYQGLKDRKKIFDMMQQKYYVLTKSYYNDEALLAELESKYDIFIAGSDQIWNINARDYSDAYFLYFIKEKRKIAYAPSFGSRIEINGGQRRRISDFLKSFDWIAMREATGKILVESLIRKEVPLSLDPTLLLDKTAYAMLEKTGRQIRGRYIFFYSINYNADSMKVVTKFAELHHLPVVVIFTSYHVYKCRQYGFRIITAAGPDTFLSLVKNADYVLSNSFHGTAFSIIYQKRFYTIADAIKNIVVTDDRIIYLLNLCGLEDRQLSVLSEIREYQPKEIDYEKVNALLEVEIKNSRSILKNTLFN